MRDNLPSCINPLNVDAELVLEGILSDIAESKAPELALFQSPVKQIPPTSTAAPAKTTFPAHFQFIDHPPSAATGPSERIAAARLLLASLSMSAAPDPVAETYT